MNNIVIFGSPRTGSTYLHSVFYHILHSIKGKANPHGEFFNFLFEEEEFPPKIEELRQYLDDGTSGNVLKIFGKQLLETYRHIILDLIFTHDTTSTVLIYRDNIYEQFLSLIISRVTGIWQMNYGKTNTLQIPEITDRVIIDAARAIIDGNRELQLVYDKYKDSLDSVLKYEDLTGTPQLDFKIYNQHYGIDFPIEEFPSKNTTLSYKLQHLPVDRINIIWHRELENANYIPTFNISTNKVKDYFRQ